MSLLFFANQIDKFTVTWRKCCLIGAIMSILSACGSFGAYKSPPPPCPKVLLLKNADSITYFRPAQIKDFTDILATIKIVNFTGECSYNRKRTKANFRLKLIFEIERGPADKKKETSFQYFVAIPKFHPAPKGKGIFPLRAKFKGNQTRIKLLDEISVEIPMAKNHKVDQYSVYIGLQVTPQQLKYNRLQSDRALRR